MQSADFMLQQAIRLARVTPRVAASAPTKDDVRNIEAGPDLAPAPTKEDWVERQRQIHPPLKPAWFSIVEEIVPDAPRRPRIEEIQRAVARHFGVSRDDLLCARRTANIVIPRQVAVYLSKTLTLKSLPEIGRRFGGRDHTTILHSVRRIVALTAKDSDLRESVDSIKQELGAA